MNGSLATSKRNGISWTYVVARATVLVTTNYATRLRLMRRDYSATCSTPHISVHVHTIPIIIKHSENF